MLRVIGEPLLLFSLPFLVYAVIVILLSKRLEKGRAWSVGHVSGLVLAGLAAALGGLLLLGYEGPNHRGAYIPAHIESGQLVPGRWE